MDSLSYWAIALSVGLGTYLLRASFLLFPVGPRVATRIEPVLRYVPSAALAALVLPAVLPVGSEGWSTFEMEKPIAASVAALVAFKTKSVLATIASGMILYWVGGYLLELWL